MYKRNKRSHIYNHVNRNVIYPLYNPAFANKDFSTGVEIVEINSEDNNENNPSDSYDKIESENDRYHECKDETLNGESSFKNADNYSQIYADSMIDYEAIRSIYSEFYNNDCFDKNENVASNHYDNLFTILENENCSESSSEDDRYKNYELNKHTTRKHWDENSSYEDDIFTCNENFNGQERNILIYSFKNTCYLTEIASKVGESNNNNVNEVENETFCSDRVPTPVPAYIPRFNLQLNPTLSTVTEISEPKQFTSIITTECVQSESDIKKPANSWLQDININNSFLPIHKPDYSSFVKTPLKEQKLLHKNEMSQEPNSDFNYKDIKSLQPNIILNSNRPAPDPDVTIYFKLHDSCDSSFEDKKDLIHKVINAQLIERIENVESLVNENLRELRQPLIKLTAKMKSDTNTIIFLIEKIEDDNVDREDEVKEVYDLDLDSTAQRCSQSNSEIINVEILESECPNDVPQENIEVIIKTDVHLKKQTWFKKLIKCFRCCK